MMLVMMRESEGAMVGTMSDNDSRSCNSMSYRRM